MPEARTPERDGRVAVGHHLRHLALLGRNRVLEVEIRLAPGVPRLEQLHVGVDDRAVLLAEGERDLVPPELQVEAVDAAEHAQHEHVLAAPRIGHQGTALALQRQLDHAVAALDERVDGFVEGLHDRRIAAVPPDVFQEDRGAGLQFAGAHAAQEHLLVEGHDEVGFIAAVGHFLRADADADAAGARHAARRRLDLGRNDLHGPDAVAAARGDAGERLAAALRAFAGIADHLDDVLGEVLRGFRGSGRGSSAFRSLLALQLGRFAHGVASVIVRRNEKDRSGYSSRTRAKLCSSTGMPKRRAPGSSVSGVYTPSVSRRPR